VEEVVDDDDCSYPNEGGAHVCDGDDKQPFQSLLHRNRSRTHLINSLRPFLPFNNTRHQKPSNEDDGSYRVLVSESEHEGEEVDPGEEYEHQPPENRGWGEGEELEDGG